MPEYRVTVRFGRSRKRYRVYDIEAEDFPAALREAADRIPPEVAAETDLVEARLQVRPETREYTPE